MCNKLGIRSASVAKQSSHLDYNHPSMIAVRSFISRCQAEHNIEPRLIANFDQVWSTFYEAPRRVLYKHASKRGEIFAKKEKPSIEKMISSIRKALSLTDVEEESHDKEVCKAVKLNAGGNLNPVDYGRVPRTTTTLSWSDGDLGKSFITLHPGTMYEPKLFCLFFFECHCFF